MRHHFDRCGCYTVIPSRGGEHLGASIALTPDETMEDTGSGRLLTGEGAVHFDPAFASTINASRGYEVFLTPKLLQVTHARPWAS